MSRQDYEQRATALLYEAGWLRNEGLTVEEIAALPSVFERHVERLPKASPVGMTSSSGFMVSMLGAMRPFTKCSGDAEVQPSLNFRANVCPNVQERSPSMETKGSGDSLGRSG